ncbi:sugar ABC transporter substrate-binding protein [Bacillaceae bacterium SIJ1]|uniref:ABC transporter substrate-binding protein n=1 Tax=Litoribacterium kuwaitense TaxID=1398745 RepID=UPI0013EAD459|nr:sugar ABC transporter substrate-binding protein [Litoribacterium kuwaitense]NGP45370.1 sugar ABC transporter substrate-binding protein [Litoribacterium kuwaitense]
MRNVHFIQRIVFCCLVALLLSACGANNNDNAASENEDADGTITLQVMDWSDSVKTIREEFHNQFMEKYPNIKIEYTQLTVDQFKNTILTAVKSGEAPDLFPVPSGMKLETLVTDGWFQPIDPLIDQEFKDMFVEGTFTEGITMNEGQIYAIPEAQTMPHSLVFYNKTLFEEAGLDPENPPETYSEFREAAQKITDAGAGQYYGMIEGGKQNNRWLTTAKEWASMAGAGLNSSSPVNLATGSTDYATEPVNGVFELFENLRDDGSLHPKTMSISAPEARALFGQGQAGFMVQGAWSIGVWNKENPDLDFGVMAPPVPDSGRKGSIPIVSSAPWMGIYAGSDHPEEAALYLEELYGGDYFQAERVSSGDSFSTVKGINEEFVTDENLKDYYDIVQEVGSRIPDPVIRNPETVAVFNEYNDVHPDLGGLLGGVVSKAVDNPEQMLKTYSEQVGVAWTKAIEAAQEKGADIEETDFVFPNWDPLEDYTEEDYAELK